MTTDADDTTEFPSPPGYDPHTYDIPLPPGVPWEPAMIEESTIEPIFFCVERMDGAFVFIRRSDVLRMWLTDRIEIEYMECQVNGKWTPMILGGPRAANVDLIEFFCELSGIEPVDVGPLVLGGEDE